MKVLKYSPYKGVFIYLIISFDHLNVIHSVHQILDKYNPSNAYFL